MVRSRRRRSAAGSTESPLCFRTVRGTRRRSSRPCRALPGLLRAGRLRLTGLAPNGRRFVANPLHIWIACESSARLQGADLGATSPAPEQAQLSDFAIPQRGMFVVGRAFFA